MPITVIVRAGTEVPEARLTFDGMQRIVIGRGGGCDVRLPDPSVSHRHAYLCAQGSEFVVVDEGSTNGTFVGDVPVAARTSRLVRSGDLVRLGRVWLELRTEQRPVTRDVALATREMALALVARVMDRRGDDRTARVRVVEGPDQGAALALGDETRTYRIGRSPECDLALTDGDVSREHARVARRGQLVVVCDLGTKNGTWLGEGRLPKDVETPWRPAQMMRIGGTVLALEEPVSETLAEIEGAPDDALPADEIVAVPVATPPPAPVVVGGETSAPAAAAEGADASGVSSAAPLADLTSSGPPLRRQGGRKRPRWSIADLVVMAAALSMLVLSIAGLVWLLR